MSEKTQAKKGQQQQGGKGKQPAAGQQDKGKGKQGQPEKKPNAKATPAAAAPAAAAAQPQAEARATSPRGGGPAGAPAAAGAGGKPAAAKKVKVEKEKGSGIVKAVLSGDRIEVYVDDTTKRTTWVPPQTKELKLSNIKAPLPRAVARGDFAGREEEVRVQLLRYLSIFHSIFDRDPTLGSEMEI